MAAILDQDDDDDADRTQVGSRAEITSLLRKPKADRPSLVVVSGGSIGQMVRLDQRLVLGRAPQCDLRLEAEGVSRRHAMIERTVEGLVQLVDLESRNGTFLNGEPVSRATLRDGDKIQIGTGAILRFSYQDELDEALHTTLYESATRDPLTRAINRRGFDEALAKEYAFARRHSRPLSAIAFDVDHFKRVNDVHGHAAGDAVLRQLVAIVSATLRREDVLARVGGEEFVILLRDICLRDAYACSERVRQSVERALFEGPSGRIPVTISLGIASLQPSHESSSAMLAAADRCLYDAKEGGRNRTCTAERLSVGRLSIVR